MFPDVNSDRILTKMHKNLLAAEYSAEQEGFSQAEEYTFRLNAELQR